jgi:2-polyprenyl-3-methyl-5-hydroxy-6-metoxy-1,4-benzoquinol methylase
VKPLDKFLQSWRIKQVKPFIPEGSRVLDIGCAYGALYRMLKSQIAEYVGIDPVLSESVDEGKFKLIVNWFPGGLPERSSYDVITMLAVIEHIPEEVQREVAIACVRYLKQNGFLILTTPSPIVDKLLDVMVDLRIVDGMSLEEHHAFNARQVPIIFAFDNLKLVMYKRFQLGLNNLFVFQKIESTHNGEGYQSI